MTQKSAPNESGLGPLFDPPVHHLIGRTDPPTSREAADALVRSGRLGRDQQEAYELVHHYPGSTSKDLGHLACAIDEDNEHARQRIGRRLNELEKAGLIRREGVRDGCCIWWPV